MTVLVSQTPSMIASDIFYNLSTINLCFPKRGHSPCPEGLLALLVPQGQFLFTLTAESSLGHAHLKYRRRDELMGDHDQVWRHSGPKWGNHRGKRVEEQGCHHI